MPSSIAGNRVAREAVLARVRKALRKSADRSDALAEAERYVAAHAHGPRPAMPRDLTARFMARATDMASTVEQLPNRSYIAKAVARYVNALELPPSLASHQATVGVCWPELGDLDWIGAGLSIDVRPTIGDDRLGITGCYCAIAETGTLVLTSGADTPTATALLPDTHVAVVDASRIVSGMEEAFALMRAEHGMDDRAGATRSRSRNSATGMPRAFNMISGPSRTGDIEQTIVLGAHGPYRLHILVIG